MGTNATISGGLPYDLLFNTAGTCTCADPAAYASTFYDCPTGPSCSISNYNQPSSYLACTSQVCDKKEAVGSL